jgi:hypothetical protein
MGGCVLGGELEVQSRGCRMRKLGMSSEETDT